MPRNQDRAETEDSTQGLPNIKVQRKQRKGEGEAKERLQNKGGKSGQVSRKQGTRSNLSQLQALGWILEFII